MSLQYVLIIINYYPMWLSYSSKSKLAFFNQIELKLKGNKFINLLKFASKHGNNFSFS